MCLFLAALGLHYCAGAFSSCREQGLRFLVACGPLTAVASLAAEHGGFPSCSSRALEQRLSCSEACGIFPDLGSNLRPLHWQDSPPLHQQSVLSPSAAGGRERQSEPGGQSAVPEDGHRGEQVPTAPPEGGAEELLGGAGRQD